MFLKCKSVFQKIVVKAFEVPVFQGKKKKKIIIFSKQALEFDIFYRLGQYCRSSDCRSSNSVSSPLWFEPLEMFLLSQWTTFEAEMEIQ